jgi:hypothetical protein
LAISKNLSKLFSIFGLFVNFHLSLYSARKLYCKNKKIQFNMNFGLRNYTCSTLG